MLIAIVKGWFNRAGLQMGAAPGRGSWVFASVFNLVPWLGGVGGGFWGRGGPQGWETVGFGLTPASSLPGSRPSLSAHG